MVTVAFPSEDWMLLSNSATDIVVVIRSCQRLCVRERADHVGFEVCEFLASTHNQFISYYVMKIWNDALSWT
jgi:hypothetical protein